MSDCTIVFTNKTESSHTVASFIQQPDHIPLLAWAEPDPHCVDPGHPPGRRSDFMPLVLGMPSWPAHLPLLEARLFFENSARHIVANQAGCTWVEIKEISSEETSCEDASCEKKTLKVTREEFPVLTLRDYKRFGLDEGFGLNNEQRLKAIEYRQKGRLVGWRLTRETPKK